MLLARICKSFEKRSVQQLSSSLWKLRLHDLPVQAACLKLRNMVFDASFAHRNVKSHIRLKKHHLSSTCMSPAWHLFDNIVINLLDNKRASQNDLPLTLPLSFCCLATPTTSVKSHQRGCESLSGGSHRDGQARRRKRGQPITNATGVADRHAETEPKAKLDDINEQRRRKMYSLCVFVSKALIGNIAT